MYIFSNNTSGTRWRFELLAPILGLLALMVLAVGFTYTVAKIQFATAAYVSGQSIWSRAQLATVYYLDRYSRAGDQEDLERAREWLAIPLADREARQAMAASPIREEEARAALIRGDNHPEDAAGMVWLYRHFSGFGPLQQAVRVWEASDEWILRLQSLTEEMAQTSEPAALEALQKELGVLNRRLDTQTEQFRSAMIDAARWVTRFLSTVSVVFLVVIIVLAGLLSAWTLRVLRYSESRFRAIFEQAAVGIAQLDGRGVIRDINPAFGQILGLPREQLVGCLYQDLIHPEDVNKGDEFREELRRRERSAYTLEKRLKCADGKTVWGRVTVSLGQGQEFVVILEDVSESRRLSMELSHQATHDALTGLFNRRAFEHRLTETLGRARTENSHHTLAFIDLDQFKVVNDTSGHFAGDRLLQQAVGIFRRCLREGDMLARLGGDEFGVIFEHCDPEQAVPVAEKLRVALDETPFAWEGNSYDISCSIGLVSISAGTPDVEHVLKSADVACYLAKEHGRNRIHLTSDKDEAQRERLGQMQWVNRIRAALAEDRLFLEAQRIVPVREGASALCYEVLVRLRSETGEVVPPGVFLPAAERFGAVHQIDRWVVREVMRQLARHPAHLAELQTCHINLSGGSLDQADFGAFVIEVLREFGIPPGKICFEITETAAVNNLAEALDFMELLGDLGCQFALDDFGTGLSSFAYLRRLPIHCLKIDGVFVRDIANDETDRAMVRAINEIGKTLGKHTVAEFVETEEAMAWLREIGVDGAQGFWVHRPCAFETLLRENRHSVEPTNAS
ncbi:diguanylate cyclase/phosphodiesterase with PAS/PAC sensor(s) [Marinimicrobium koreense]|uniref:Diguanylate cyclase/phosphodiesterase with PAS/PAC sensor(S) n=1 Tax=Marinimicrobium koreense TaxID=306545 RepID=A0A3N1NSJ0_9GAMM|nr:EAL domain-containing protein [Marinimicrobium koreense]ROQ21812.1 diguanylate cyclase/phosphodiesterase with PAS/PAC sensor(s) [Marinimicrobium koreense]